MYGIRVPPLYTGISDPFAIVAIFIPLLVLDHDGIRP